MRSAPSPLQLKAVQAFAGGLAALFWVLRAPSFGPGDSPQHVLSALTLGVSRPPGYPLLNFLGWLVSRTPFGDPAAAVNGLSGLLHAGAAGFLALLLLRQGAGLPAALSASALMALSPLFWFYSEVAEARALNDFLALGAAYWAVSLCQEGGRRRLLLLGAFAGLGLSHHPTFALILPALAYWIWRARSLAPRLWAALAALALAFTALPYALLWLRLRLLPPPVYNPDGVSSAADLLGLFLRLKTGGLLRMLPGQGLVEAGGFDAAALARHAWWFLASFGSDLALVALLLAAAGAALLLRSKTGALIRFWALWLFGAAAPFLLLSSQQLTVPDPDYLRAVSARFYLLPAIAVYGLCAFALDALYRKARRGFAWSACAACLLLPVLLRPLSQRGREPLMEYARDILRGTGSRDIVLLGADDTIFAALYLQRAVRAAEERVFVEPGLLAYPPYARELVGRHPDLRIPLQDGAPSLDWGRWLKLNPGRAVYAEAPLAPAAAAPGLHPEPSGSLVRLARRPAPREAVLKRCADFLDEDFLGRLTRAEVHAFTQEVYLLRAAQAQLSWCAGFLSPKDEALARRLLARLDAL